MSMIRGLSLFGLCMAFVVIALGAWTRLVDAGLGCPDWPGCYGFVVFPTSEADVLLAEQRYPQFPYEIDKAIPEVVHRYFAAFLGLIAIALTVTAFKYKLPAENQTNYRIFAIFYMLPRYFWVPYGELKTTSDYCHGPPFWRLHYIELIFLFIFNLS